MSEPRETPTSDRDWFETSPGRDVLGAEGECLRRILPMLFGHHLLQVGRRALPDAVASSRIPHGAIVDALPEGPAELSTVRGRPDALPVESSSVDLVLLPHVLGRESDPPAVLREALRVLVPEGHLVVCGINPWSLLGLQAAVVRRRGSGRARGAPIALARLRDWLSVLGFDVVMAERCFFRPPFASERLLRRLAFLERLGGVLPFLAGSHVVLARKRVITLTPIRPGWTLRRRFAVVGLASSATRQDAGG